MSDPWQSETARPFWKRAWFWIGSLLVLLLIVGVLIQSRMGYGGRDDAFESQQASTAIL